MTEVIHRVMVFLVLQTEIVQQTHVLEYVFLVQEVLPRFVVVIVVQIHLSVSQQHAIKVVVQVVLIQLQLDSKCFVMVILAVKIVIVYLNLALAKYVSRVLIRVVDLVAMEVVVQLIVIAHQILVLILSVQLVMT